MVGVAFAGEPMTRLRVLVVDDEAVAAEVVERYLLRDGFDVAVEANGEKALTVARTWNPDLVVLDLMLPSVGLEVCRQLRRAGQIPIVMLTARGEETDRIVGLELGADDYVVKPFSPRELAARIRAVLRRASPEQTERASGDALRFGSLLVKRQPPVSLHPLEPEDALSGLMQVKPQGKEPAKDEEESGESEPETEEAS